MCRQWRFQYSGSTRAFDYALYCRTRACMLCMFVLPPTSLNKVGNSGSFLWALSVFIYFCFMMAFRVQFAGDVNQKISFATTAFSNMFARSLLGLIDWSPFWIGFEFQSNGQYPFENNFKRTINCLATRANMNEPKTWRINWRYHCSVTCVT